MKIVRKIPNKWLVGSLTISIVVNLLVLLVDVIPYFSSRLNIDLELSVKGISEDLIVEQALDMVASDEVVMEWSEPGGFTKTMIRWYRGGDKTYKLYNYPKAYLFYGLSEYLIKVNNFQGLEKVKSRFDQLVDAHGDPVYCLDKVDQIPFGLTSLNLYKCNKTEKYLFFADSLYAYLKKSVDEKYGVILYRSGGNCQFVDVIGMVVPFLVEYYRTTQNIDALLLAEKQLDFYISYGIDKDTYIPSHGVNLETKVKTGSINWGRGIGWYLLGLVYLNDVTGGKYNKEYERIVESIINLKNEDGLWTQFPGSSEKYDASATTMFLLGLSYSDDFCKNNILSLIKIGSNGRVKCTSGDTYGLNWYSSSFGDSELSQGMLLLLLSRLIK